MCYPLDEYFTAEMCGWYGGQVYPGTCDPNPCVECNADEDCPEGEYCCGGACEPDPCPKCVGVDVDGCLAVAVCGSGAGNGDPCDPSLPSPPTTPPLDCLGGGPATVTVTGSNFVCGTACSGGNAAFAAFVESALNASYAVDFGCTASSSGEYYYLTYNGTQYYIYVLATVSSLQYGLLVLGVGGSAVASIEVNLGLQTPTVAACGANLYDCSGFSGSTANGDIDVA
jgi:hypothetical protein